MSYRMAPAQEHWFRHMSGLANAPLNNVATILEFEGGVEIGRLRRALMQIVARHEALRSRVLAPDRMEVLSVEECAGVASVDVASLGEAASWQAVRDLTSVSLDLAGPPIRVAHVRMPERQVLVLTQAHFANDGWGLRLVLEELAQAFRVGALDKPTASGYRDFAVWQRTWVEGSEGSAMLAAATARLASAQTPQPLPYGATRPRAFSKRGETSTLSLGRDLVRGLQREMRQSGASLFAVCMAWYVATIALSSGSGDVVVGSAHHNRLRRLDWATVGDFAHAFLVRCRVDEAWTFRALVDAVRLAVADGVAQAAVPYWRLHQSLGYGELPSMPPLHQFGLLVGTASRPPLDFGPDAPLVRSHGKPFLGEAVTDMFLVVGLGASTVDLTILHAADLVDPLNARRWLNDLAAAGDAWLRAPDVPIGVLWRKRARHIGRLVAASGPQRVWDVPS